MGKHRRRAPAAIALADERDGRMSKIDTPCHLPHAHLMAMNVSLTRALEDFVNKKVASGRYGSASEVVREALRLLEDRERIREAQIAELRGEVTRGIVQLDAGEGVPLDMAKVKAHARRKLARKRRA